MVELRFCITKSDPVAPERFDPILTQSWTNSNKRENGEREESAVRGVVRSIGFVELVGFIGFAELIGFIGFMEFVGFMEVGSWSVVRGRMHAFSEFIGFIG